MLTSPSRRRSALAVASLLFSVLLVGAASNAGASYITYNIVDYPTNETDGPLVDLISGTIITDGTIGPLSSANIVGGTFSFTDSEGDLITGPATFVDPIDLQATPTQLLLCPGVDSCFGISASEANPPWGVGVTYENFPGDGLYYGGIYPIGGAIVLYPFMSAPVSADPGSIGANSDWVIAAVPEPTSRALLCSALLGLGVAYLRWRWIRRLKKSRGAFGALLSCVSRTVPGNHRISVGPVGPASGRSKVRRRVTWASYLLPHFDSLSGPRSTRGCKRSFGWTHRPRTLAFEPLEGRTLLSVSLPTAWQATPIGNYDLIATPIGNYGSCRHVLLREQYGNRGWHATGGRRSPAWSWNFSALRRNDGCLNPRAARLKHNGVKCCCRACIRSIQWRSQAYISTLKAGETVVRLKNGSE